MKKIYLLAFAIFTLTSNSFAGGVGCSIDPTNTTFFSPGPDSIPCIERGVFFEQTIQIHVPNTFDISTFVGLPAGFVVLTVDSLDIDSITGFPTGVQYVLNPAGGHFLGGDNGCTYAFGTTTDAKGNYPLTVHGTISLSNIPQGFGFPPDSTFDLQSVQSMSGFFTLGVDVINPGDTCRPQQVSGIGNFNQSLNTVIQIYPNPNNGNFELRLNAGRRALGEILVLDLTGRKVFAQPVDVSGVYSTTIQLSNLPKGMYALQLRTADGFATKTISIE